MKKGFTLIELLAVIVILAIIALIATPIVLNIINGVRSSAEVESANFLIDIVNNYIATQYLQGNKITEEQIFVIKDDIEYQLDKDGNRTQTNNFKHKGKLCDYCVVKVNEDKEISILYEGSNQDIKKEYKSTELKQEKLKESRELVSMYNELLLFRDIYLKNNAIDDVKYFKTDDDIIYEILSTGEEVALSQLYNTSGQSKIKLLNTNDYTITISTEDYVYEFNNEGDIVEAENVNSKYSKEILELYDELVISSERYISKTTISDELYFEFKDGVINKVDKYGNVTQDNNMVLNPNSVGTGELRINPLNQVAIVIYDTDEDIKTDYGSTELYNEPLRYSRDGLTLVKNLARLELVAEEYSGDTGLTSDWLVLYYLRVLRYDDGLMYNAVTGTDPNFVAHVDKPESSLRTYFTSKNNFVVNGHSIDLHHLAASFAGMVYDTPLIYHIAYEELEYDCVVSWAGDLHTFMERSILRSGVKEKYGNYSNATYSLMGKTATTFEMEDVYADIDAWLLYYNLIENPSLSLADIFDKFYSGESARSYKNRYTSFISVMDDIAPKFNTSKTNFEGVVAHFTNTDKGWQTIDSLEITPTEEEELEIADGFIRWIKDQAAKE